MKICVESDLIPKCLLPGSFAIFQGDKKSGNANFSWKKWYFLWKYGFSILLSDRIFWSLPRPEISQKTPEMNVSEWDLILRKKIIEKYFKTKKLEHSYEKPKTGQFYVRKVTFASPASRSHSSVNPVQSVIQVPIQSSR